VKKRRSFAALLAVGLFLAFKPLPARANSIEYLFDYLQAMQAFWESVFAPKVVSAVRNQAALPTVPFAEALSFQLSPAQAPIFGRRADGTYINLEFQPTTPFSLLSPMSDVTQWVAGGANAVFGAPAGPAGVGLQSQTCATSVVGSDGWEVVACAGNNSATASAATSGVTPKTRNLPVGPDVNSVFFADFNGDGKPDLAVAFDGSTTIPGGIAIFLNAGNGTFASPVLYGTTAPATQFFPVGTPATRFAVFDLNHDGFPDIATASLGGTVSVFLGKGDGSFGALTQYSVGGSGEAIAIADVNGDGNPDIVTGGTTGILLGSGNGTFHPGPPLPAVASGNFIWAFAAGDLNGDGKIDVVYADTQNQVVVPIFGNGDGTFQVGQAYAVSQLPDSLVLADYNHDGRLDIINGQGDARIFGFSENSGNTDILLNNGDGTFQGVPAYFTLPNSESGNGFSYVGGMAAANFGGASPGVLASGVSGTLSLFHGDGKGGLQAPQAITLQGQVGGIATGDFNGDGLPDAALLNGGSGVAILRGTAGGFAAPTILPTAGTAIASGDFNGDGKLDLAIAGAGTLTILKGNGDGTFQTGAALTGVSSPVSLSAVDLNGDGNADLIFADNGTNDFGGAVYVALNQGGGVFQAPVKVLPGLFPAFGIADVNGDGKLDLVATIQNGQGENQVSWLAGNGNGTFQAPISITNNSDAEINSVLVQDFDGDGKVDIVLPHMGGVTTFMAGNGDGTFSAETSFLTAGASIFVESADLNGDGKPDLIVGGLTVTPLLNISTATFPCQLSSTTLQPAAAGGNLTVTIASGACALGVTGLPSWITVASTSASGVTLTVAANAGGARSANIMIGATSVTVNQAAPPACTYTLNYVAESFPAAGGPGSVNVSVNSGCPWSATAPPSWITFPSGGSGSGAGTLTMLAAANTGAARSGSFAVAGVTFNVEQQASSISGLNFIGSMPHIAAEENWTTTFTLVNKGSSSATARLSLFADPSGVLPLPLAFPQQSSTNGPELASSLDRAIASNASLVITTAGAQTPPVQIGSAQLASTGAVDGFAIFHLIPGAQEAVVPMETRNASSYVLAYDNTGGVVLGVAVENVSPQAANIGVIIRDDSGAQIGTGSLAIEASGHTSFVLSTQFPSTADKRGTIQFNTPPGGQISVLGIRTTPLGTSNTLTTIPALANIGTNGGSMAHIAAANGWQTTFVLVNTGSSAAHAHLAFFGDSGNPLSLSLTFPQTAATSSASFVDQNLAAGATLLVQASGALEDPVVIGSAQLTTSGNVGGFVIFRYNPNGQEAVVPLESRNAGGYFLAYDNTSGTATGIAINGVSSQAINIPVIVRDDTGAQIATDTLNLAANGHLAFTMVTDKYPGTADKRGTIEFDAPAGAQIGALGIRIPVAHTFTTLPALSK
jgi:hypothetical protein